MYETADLRDLRPAGRHAEDLADRAAVDFAGRADFFVRTAVLPALLVFVDRAAVFRVDVVRFAI
jgi:hypothetical protein